MHSLPPVATSVRGAQSREFTTVPHLSTDDDWRIDIIASQTVTTPFLSTPACSGMRAMCQIPFRLTPIE
ncbi:hypothetical protein BC2230_30317 [Burkholderia cepacia]